MKENESSDEVIILREKLRIAVDALKRISSAYMSPQEIREEHEQFEEDNDGDTPYGIDVNETIEYAYENVRFLAEHTLSILGETTDG